MTLPKWVEEINYADPKTKGGKEAMQLKKAIFVAIDALEILRDNVNPACGHEMTAGDALAEIERINPDEGGCERMGGK